MLGGERKELCFSLGSKCLSKDPALSLCMHGCLRKLQRTEKADGVSVCNQVGEMDLGQEKVRKDRWEQL